LVRQVKRALGEFSMLRPNTIVYFVLRPDKPLESLEMLQILRSATGKHGTVIKPVIPPLFKGYEEVTEYLRTLGYEPIEGAKVPTPQSYVELVKFCEASALLTVDKKGVVAAPLLRNDMVLLALLGSTLGDKEVFSESTPVKKHLEKSIIRPFYYVTAADIAALTFTDNKLRALEGVVEPCTPMTKHEKVTSEMLRELTWSSSELLYSSSKTIELLQKLALGLGYRCRFCLGYTLNKDMVCSYCRRIGTWPS